MRDLWPVLTVFLVLSVVMTWRTIVIWRKKPTTPDDKQSRWQQLDRSFFLTLVCAIFTLALAVGELKLHHVI